MSHSREKTMSRMSRRKQACPKQVQEDTRRSKLQQEEAVVETSELLSRLPLFESFLTCSPFDRRMQRDSLTKEGVRFPCDSREEKKGKATNLDFFFGDISTNHSITKDESNNQTKTDPYNKRLYQGKKMGEGIKEVEKIFLNEHISKDSEKFVSHNITEQGINSNEPSSNEDYPLNEDCKTKDQFDESCAEISENSNQSSAFADTSTTANKLNEDSASFPAANQHGLSPSTTSRSSPNDGNIDPEESAHQGSPLFINKEEIARKMGENYNEFFDGSPDFEKENLTSEKMIQIMNKSVLMKKKSSESTVEETKELKKIKEQVKMLQQQQMYQVQMLNYLQFQLNLMANNPQSQPKPSPGNFPLNGINGISFQGMPSILAAAASMAGSENQPPHPPQSNNILPSVAAVINQQLTANKMNETPQNVFGSAQNFANKNFELEKDSKDPYRKEANGYNPLSSLALLQNPSSQARPNPSDIMTKHIPDALESDDSLLKHSCRFCQKVFGSDSALQIHLRSHTGERPFKCNICANRFSTKGNLKVHFIRHKDKYPHIEMNPNPVPEHLDNVPTSSGIPYGMSVVPDALSVDDDLKESLEEPGTISPFKKRSVELPVPYQCIDNKNDIQANLALKIEKSKSMENHVKYNELSDKSSPPKLKEGAFHYPENNDLVNSSQFGFNLENLMKNCERNGENLSTGVPASLNEDTHDLEVTNPVSSSETTKLQQLVEQIDRGKELEKNECHICHRVLSCQSALKLHYRTHTGERPYKCDLCSRAFTTRGNLRTHYSSVHRQHLQSSSSTDNLSYRGNSLHCPICGSRFLEQQAFQQHMQIHIYMHNQQQALQAMNGQMPTAGADHRMVEIMNNRMAPSMSLERRFSQHEGQAEQSNSDNDEVFDENLPEDKEESNHEVLRIDQGSHATNPAPENCSGAISSAYHYSINNSVVDSRAKDNKENSENDSTCNPRRERFNINTDEEEKLESTSKDTALDLSRPSSNSSSSTSEVKNHLLVSSPSLSSTQTPLTTPNNSLNALASLASNQSPNMQLNGTFTTNTQTLSYKEEGRARKMTTACDICNKPFTCQSALEIHLRSHTKERPFACRVCERGFTTKGNLKQHLLTHDITDVDDEMLEPVNSPLNGGLTTQSPPANPSLQNQTYNHLKRPLEGLVSAPPSKKIYPRHWCTKCQKQFSSASSLQIHNRTHTGEKPFACSVCGRAFTTKGNLKVHMGTHVWGAGGSRRGRRISMDNPLISPWMQNTSNSNSQSNPIRPRAPPQLATVPEQAAIYHQYAAAFASGIINNKMANDPRFQGHPMMNLNNAAKLLIPNNFSAAPIGPTPTNDKIESGVGNQMNKSVAEIASEWIRNVYRKSQEQGVN